MINKNKIQIYKKYSGDIDAFVRMATIQEKQIISDIDWKLIDDIINDIYLESRGLVSLEMKNKIKKKIKENIHDEHVLHELILIASSDM